MIYRIYTKLKYFYHLVTLIGYDVNKSILIRFKLENKDFEVLKNKSEINQLKEKFSNNKIFTIKNDYAYYSGLYRLIDKTNGGGRQINIMSGNVMNDLISLMPCFERGNQDDCLSYEEKKRKLFVDNLILTCGPVSRFVKNWLNEFYPKVNARIVHWFTDKELNDYNNGHTCLEVYVEELKRWIVFDFNRACLYKQNEVYLSAFECNALMREDFRYINHGVDPSFKTKGIRYTFFEKFMKTEAGKKMYLERIFSNCIMEEHKNYYGVKNQNKYVNKIVLKYYKNIKLMSYKEFEKKFYTDYSDN